MLTTHSVQYFIFAPRLGEVQNKTRRIFIQRYISTRHVWINEESLSRLESLAANEALGPYVTKLLLHVSEWDQEEIKKSFPDSTHGNDQDKRLLEAHRGLDKQRYLLASGMAVDSLSGAISHMCNLKDFTISEVESENELWPFSHFKHGSKPGLLTGMDADVMFYLRTSVWLVVMRSLSTARVRLQQFKCAPLAGARHGFTSLPRSLLTNLSYAFEQLDCLRLGVRIPYLEPSAQRGSGRSPTS